MENAGSAAGPVAFIRGAMSEQTAYAVRERTLRDSAEFLANQHTLRLHDDSGSTCWGSGVAARATFRTNGFLVLLGIRAASSAAEHGQYFAPASAGQASALDERTGDLASIQKHWRR